MLLTYQSLTAKMFNQRAFNHLLNFNNQQSFEYFFAEQKALFQGALIYSQT